jgi:pantoate kinase
MASTPEALVKKKIRKILDDNKVYYAMPIGTGYGNSGVPDFLCCVAGRFVAVEAKAGKGTTTALQEDHLARIKESRGVTMVINEKNLDSLMPLIRYMRRCDE